MATLGVTKAQVVCVRRGTKEAQKMQGMGGHDSKLKLD